MYYIIYILLLLVVKMAFVFFPFLLLMCACLLFIFFFLSMRARRAFTLYRSNRSIGLFQGFSRTPEQHNSPLMLSGRPRRRPNRVWSYIIVHQYRKQHRLTIMYNTNNNRTEGKGYIYVRKRERERENKRLLPPEVINNATTWQGRPVTPHETRLL